MSKELSNIKEVRSRGADIVLFIKESLAKDIDRAYDTFHLPDMQDEFMVMPASVHCSYLLIMFLPTRDLTWISQETWRR